MLDKYFGLKGKVALVTGGGRGIGQVVARDLARAGAKIAIFSRSGADETVNIIIEEGGDAVSILVDVTVEESVDKGMQVLLDTYGRLDIVFNNAGICLHKSALEASIQEWKDVVDTNLTGEYIVARAAAKVMIDKGIHGSIINMASMSGSIVNIPQWQASYNASKAGVIHMTKSLAMEWVEYGIRVNSISPGYIATPMSADEAPELIAQWMPLIPMHRMGKPEELGGAIIFLASEAGGYTTGRDFIIDGGYSSLY